MSSADEDKRQDGGRHCQRNLRSAGLLLLIGTVILLLAGFFLFESIRAQQNSNGHSGTGSLATGAKDQAAFDDKSAHPEIPRIGLADAKTAFDQKQAVFVDVRDPASYQVSHIPGAINILLKDMDQRFAEIQADAWVITYCT